MRIAIPYENGNIFQHFGRSEAFKFYDIGGGAQSALTEAGIRFYGGVSGSADAAVQALLDGSLGYDPEARCDHHDHAHGAGHTCGEHGCGEHGCHS